jgi:hypothetical protein
MGEYVPVKIKFGGKIQRDQVPHLLVALEQCQLRTETGEADPEPGNLTETFGGDANYGQIEEVTSVCHMLNLDYEQITEGSSAFDGSITRYVGKQLESLDCNEAGDALIPLSKVLEIETLTQGMANLINIAKFWAKPLVLEIIP